MRFIREHDSIDERPMLFFVDCGVHVGISLKLFMNIVRNIRTHSFLSHIIYEMMQYGYEILV
jgi:hypothetical protein